eukprot:TRINITY_DN10581_c0_g2_i1.p1 TRINITY_DN10581_c0_g2~~TRINITY_DN10581_c0_g2_i1.p1  ORF type:complete len:314 (+),score=35.92 TRINITY_DN10581_c0_g2_i1:112-1053(+)
MLRSLVGSEMCIRDSIVGFLCILVQFDKAIRHARPHLHRLVGRLYVVAGTACVLTLRVLRSTSGAGSDPEHRPDIGMKLFIDTASCLWCLVTAVAVYQIVVRGDHDRHRQWMTWSMGILTVPIAQRFISFVVLTPVFAFLRGLICVARFGDPPWTARWGAPGSAWSLLWDVAAPASHADPRASPVLWSFDGFGEGEQASFALSAWTGLLLVLYASTRQLSAFDERSYNAHMFTAVSSPLAAMGHAVADRILSWQPSGRIASGLSFAAALVAAILFPWAALGSLIAQLFGALLWIYVIFLSSCLLYTSPSPRDS